MTSGRRERRTSCGPLRGGCSRRPPTQRTTPPVDSRCLRDEDVAAEAGDVRTAIGADDQLDSTYAVTDPAGERAALLAQLAKTVRPAADVPLLIDAIDEATAHAVAVDDYDLAARSAELAVATAAHGNDPAMVRRAAARGKGCPGDQRRLQRSHQADGRGP